MELPSRTAPGCQATGFHRVSHSANTVESLVCARQILYQAPGHNGERDSPGHFARLTPGAAGPVTPAPAQGPHYDVPGKVSQSPRPGALGPQGLSALHQPRVPRADYPCLCRLLGRGWGWLVHVQPAAPRTATHPSPGSASALMHRNFLPHSRCHVCIFRSHSSIFFGTRWCLKT